MSDQDHHPHRIQLRRTKGWRKPDGTVIVSRPSKWGNPIRVVRERSTSPCRWMWRVSGSPLDRNGGPAYADLQTARYFAAQNFKWDLLNGRFGDAYPSVEEIVAELAGRDLACWCPIRQHRNGRHCWGECHADILLELANGGVG